MNMKPRLCEKFKNPPPGQYPHAPPAPTARAPPHMSGFAPACPEDWLEAPPHGEAFHGVLPCKAPLQGYAVPAEHAWTPSHARAACARALGDPPATVVDLTSGAGFYNRFCSPWGDAAYSVIPCTARTAARDDAPTEEAWHAFYLAMASARAQQGPVLVHCRHGFNRTGYMLCRWAVVTGRAPTGRAAVAAFAAARPPGIYKAAYLATLYLMLGEAPLERAPVWPSWRAARRTLDSLPAVWRLAFGDGPTSRPFPAALKAPPSSAHAIGGVVPWSARHHDADARLMCSCVVRAEVARACGCRDDAFGGVQPVALRRACLQRLRIAYAVTWKADGVRMLVAVMPFGTFGVNRRNEV